MINNDFPDFPYRQTVIPEVEVAGDVIRWRPGGTRLMGPLNRVLYDFTKLKEEAEFSRSLFRSAVQVFVKRYGPLYLCSKHGWPVFGHLEPDSLLCPPRYRKEGRDLFLEEPVARYLELSRRAFALVKVAEKARLGTPLTAAEIRAATLLDQEEASAKKVGAVRQTVPMIFAPPLRDVVGIDSKERVQALVNAWLWLGDPRPWLALRANGNLELEFKNAKQLIRSSSLKLTDLLMPALPQLAIGGQLFAALAMQLAMNASGGVGMTTCNGCNKLYTPKRTPNPEKLHFCSRCGKSASKRLSKRRMANERKKREREKSENGGKS